MEMDGCLSGILDHEEYPDFNRPTDLNDLDLNRSNELNDSRYELTFQVQN